MLRVNVRGGYGGLACAHDGMRGSWRKWNYAGSASSVDKSVDSVDKSVDKSVDSVDKCVDSVDKCVGCVYTLN